MPLEVGDVVAIQQLYSRYAFAADSGDGERFAACFTPNGVMDMGSRSVSGSDALSAFAERIPVSSPGVRHITTNLLVEGDGDAAQGRAYLTLISASASPVTVLRTGSYEDRLTRSGDGWRFVERRFLPDRPAERPPS
jgi:hypothetical protein